MKMRSVGDELFHVDGRTDMIRNFANVPKTRLFIITDTVFTMRYELNLTAITQTSCFQLSNLT